ncbi:DUF4395 domain-containing protein [Demequina sp. NBRC 110051]|uniref:DUF4395 domain-containing protein n=1 Tax=Demequina sp. NBRC 110051 TaxID=1570340 RepID=UPI0009FD0720|nr:DUF4395 domain-containing protein [Demequina sp. NBRC 110051]
MPDDVAPAPAPAAAPSPAPSPAPGRWVDGYAVSVVNERAMRAAAGLLFAAGFAAWGWGLTTGDLQFMRMFGILFAVDMMLRLFVTGGASPTVALGSLAVRRQQPEWVDARSKAFAWGLGLTMALAGCFSLGWLGLTAVAQTICGLCLALLFAETAFGLCVGCALARRFTRQAPQHCPGGTCDATDHAAR